MYFYIVVWNSVILSGRCLLSIKIWIYPKSGFLHFLHYTDKWKNGQKVAENAKLRKQKRNHQNKKELFNKWWSDLLMIFIKIKKDESVCNSCYSPILWVHVIWSKQLFIVISFSLCLIKVLPVAEVVTYEENTSHKYNLDLDTYMRQNN